MDTEQIISADHLARRSYSLYSPGVHAIGITPWLPNANLFERRKNRGSCRKGLADRLGRSFLSNLCFRVRGERPALEALLTAR